jgi:hypothetical protein
MLKSVKESVRKMTNHLQLISGYLEMEDYTKALAKTRETVQELHKLAQSLTGLANETAHVRAALSDNGGRSRPHRKNGTSV